MSEVEEENKLYTHFNNRGLRHFRKSVGTVDPTNNKLASYSTVDLPAHKAAWDGSIEALEKTFLWKNKDGVPTIDRAGATPLHIAARRNQIDAIKWLIRYTDLSCKDQADLGETPLHVAAAHGYTDSIKALLSSEEKDLKSNLSVLQDKAGFTCLLLAIHKHQNNCAKILIEELGAKAVNAINETGITAAHVAASAGNVEVLKILSNKHKKLLNQRSTDGTTPIYFAAQEGRLQAIRYLHDIANCDLTIPSEDGLKPIHAAAQAGHTSIVKFIVGRLGNESVMDRIPDGATPLHFAASAGMLKTVQWLLNSDISGNLITATDKNGDTPTHDAAEAGRIEVLKLLLMQGADLYTTNKYGNTPYSLALSSTDPELSNLVIEFSAQTQDTEMPSKMTIFDMQGEADIMDLGDTGDTDSQNGEYDEVGPAGERKPSKRGQTSSPLKAMSNTSSDDERELLGYQSRDMNLILNTSSEYVTVTEMEEFEKVKKKKARSRGIKKTIRSALRPLSKKSRKESSENHELLESDIGFKPAFRTNPLSQFAPKIGKGAPTPPPTPATQGSDELHQLDTIVELENPYSVVDPDIIAEKRQQMQDEIDEPPPVPPQNFEFPPVQKDKESILARKPSLREWPPRPEFEASSDSELGDNDREVEEVPHMKEKEDEGVVMNGREEEETGAGNVQKNEENEDDFNPKFQIKLRKTMNIKDEPKTQQAHVTSGAGNELIEVFRLRQTKD